MGAFADQVRVFTTKVDRVSNDVFVNVVSATQDSIVNGSPVTGSPGQPVGQYGPGYHPGEVGGELKTSWTVEFESPDAAVIGTNSEHAIQNEYGISATGGPYRQRSSEGGRHSVAQTVAGFGALVADEVRKVAE
jgi:hypothetical protein